MNFAFGDPELEDIYITGKSTKHTKDIIKGFSKKALILQKILDEKELYTITSLKFEKLNNYPKGDYSIRINKKRRIVFNIKDEGNQKTIIVEELSNHYE